MNFKIKKKKINIYIYKIRREGSLIKPLTQSSIYIIESIRHIRLR